MAQILDGKAVAARLRRDIAKDVDRLVGVAGFTPALAVVLVGNDPASQVYVRNKTRQTEETGMRSIEHRLPEETPEADLLSLVEELNADPQVSGILVQFPLPAHIDADKVVATIDPAKDVDGLTPFNAGQLVLGKPALAPCTPQGCVVLAKEALGADLTGRTVVVIGRSILVGKPAALLFLNENCTVTIAHSKTHDLPGLCRTADILVPAVGRPEMVRGDWVKPGGTVIDVGINRIDAPEKGEGATRLVGDVAYAEAESVAGAITPVPGGVGPMTIALLLKNTVRAAASARGFDLSAASSA